MKEVNYYLWKLKLFKGTKIKDYEIDINNLPEDIIYSKFEGGYIKIETYDISDEELDKFLKTKNAYNLNIISICAVIFTALFVISMFL